MPAFYMNLKTGLKWVNRLTGTVASNAVLTDNIFTNCNIDASIKKHNQELYFRSFAKI